MPKVWAIFSKFKLCFVSKCFFEYGVVLGPGMILKIPPPWLLITIILRFDGSELFQSEFWSYIKLKSPVTNKVILFVHSATPIAVEDDPSIPLTPLLLL